MPVAETRDVQIAYETHGDPAHPTILMIMGLGAQLTLWPDELIDGLVAAGFHVVRFDNRDCGLSSDFALWGPPDVPAAMARLAAGKPVDAPYRLDDMAKDGIGVLDALKIRQAHVVGLSMGGMIGPVLASRFPDRALSLTCIMSSSSRPGLPAGRPEALRAVTMRPQTDDREEIIRHSMWLRRLIGGPDYGYDDATLRTFVERQVDRRYYPEGIGRQYLAVVASGDRVDLLQRLKLPTLVIHGTDDPLLPVECGRDIARLVPGARLEEIAGMGHDIPPVLAPRIATMIAGHCRAAT